MINWTEERRTERELGTLFEAPLSGTRIETRAEEWNLVKEQKGNEHSTGQDRIANMSSSHNTKMLCCSSDG